MKADKPLIWKRWANSFLFISNWDYAGMTKVEHHFVGDSFEELIRSGFQLLWPLRIVHIENMHEYVFEVYKTKVANQLNPTEQNNFRNIYNRSLKGKREGSFLFIPIEKNKNKIITCVFPNSDSAKFLYKLIGEKNNYCDEIVQFVKRDLDKVVISKLSEKEQLSEIINAISQKKTGLIRELVLRQKDSKNKIKLFQYFYGEKIPVEYWKIRYKLFENLFTQKDGNIACDKILLVVCQKGKTLHGYLFAQEEYIEKAEKVCRNIHEKKITFFVKATLPNKDCKLHVNGVIDKIQGIGGFTFEQDQRSDEIKASISLYPPFNNENTVLLNEQHEKLNLILHMISLREKIGFFPYSKPQITDMFEGHISLLYGGMESRPSLRAETLELLTNSLQWKVSEKTQKALSALNKSITEAYYGSGLKTIWAACEELVFEDDSKDRSQYFTKDERKIIKKSLKNKIEKEKFCKIMSELGKFKIKTKNSIIKNNVALLFPEWEKDKVNALIDKAFELRSKSVHTLIEREDECKNILEELRVILERVVWNEIKNAN